MGIAERKYRMKEEVRCLILETAWKQILEDGVNALSIRKIAEAIEYSVPVIYTHFESKDAILNEFMRKGYLLLQGMMAEAKQAEDDPKKQLEAMALAYWTFSHENKAYYQLMFGVAVPTCEVALRIPEVKAFGDLIKSVIKEAIEQGNHPETSVEFKFFTYWSILHGQIAIRMNGGAPYSCEMALEIVQDAIRGFIYALSA
jgi:AcrR family transcriptional regulator